MNPAGGIEDADPAQLVLMLEAALRWLREEWFEPWLTDEALSDLAGDLDVDDRRQVQHLGTPYLQERLEEVTALVRQMARGLDACRGEPGDAAARWAAAHRRPLAYVVDSTSSRPGATPRCAPSWKGPAGRPTRPACC